MSQLVEALYPLPDFRRTPLSSLRWWESRRIFFNKVVGATGLVTLAGMSLLAMLPPHPVSFGLGDAIIGAAIYGVLANGCYSFGWVLDVVAQRVWGRRAPDLGPLLFRQGLIFSVGLTLFPLLLMCIAWVIRTVAFVFG